jgi:hypothetical protein
MILWLWEALIIKFVPSCFATVTIIPLLSLRDAIIGGNTLQQAMQQETDSEYHRISPNIIASAFPTYFFITIAVDWPLQS